MGGSTKTESYEKFISEDEEIRDGFKVTSNRKKVRNVQLGLFDELKKICKKHNIKYYASGGTMLGAIRHKGFIPWDDDMDFIMFRKDYDRFIKVAPNELPEYIKIYDHYRGFSKLVNINTTCLSDNNRREKDFLGGIDIDIFPIDYASKYKIINRIKSIILRFLRRILLVQKAYGTVNKMKKGKSFIMNASNFIFIFCKVDYSKVKKLAEYISKKNFFKGNYVYSAFNTYKFFPRSIFNKSHNVKFETTRICLPDGYDTYLKREYGEYMKPVIWEGGHHSRYSTDKSYKDIIKNFDKTKSNKENYSNCKELFSL